MKKPLTFFALLCLTAVRLAWAEPARVALVIGNAAYSRAALANPVNDARAMTAALEAAGFRVTTLENASQKAMKQAVQAFAASLDGDTVALFYYSGHGVQHNGANYLIPVDTLENVQNEAQLEYEALDSGYILNAMENSGSRLNLFILDACRNSPFASATRGGQHGLAYMNGSRGTLIAYATAPGTVAYDGQGAANSPYTASLVKWMRQPLPIEQVLKNVLNEVRAATDGKQNPWYAASISSDFYFIAPSGNDTASANSDLAVPPPPAISAREDALHGDWFARLTAWADANHIDADTLPRDRDALLALDLLKLNRSGISELPAEIGALRNLQILDLSDNNLRQLPAEIGALSQLQWLWLNNNQLSKLPPSIGELRQLQRLEMAQNQLTALPAEMRQLQQLQILDLSDNQLTALPPGLDALPQLQWLNLRDNPLPGDTWSAAIQAGEDTPPPLYRHSVNLED